MSDLSYFESSTGHLNISAEDCFAFVTDIRNFERFIRQGTVNDWQSERESCSFNVSMLGTVSLRIAQKEKFNKVVYKGDALNKNDFELTLNIADNDNHLADVTLMLNADLNPMMKMIAVRPIGQFLELLIKEMENFRGWRETKE